MDPIDYPSHDIDELAVTSTVDGSAEPVLARRGDDAAGPRPLLVLLHSWSMDRHNLVDMGMDNFGDTGWHMIWPEFRGSNTPQNPRAPQAGGSRIARQDIVDAVEHACEIWDVDRRYIFLMGGSGGAHMSLMMAGFAPALWTSVAAFCGITDVAAWYGQNANYHARMECCTGGPPGPDTAAEYADRSPVSYAADIARARHVVIYHGKYDKSVPVSHGVVLWQAVQDADPAAKVFLTIFDGGHESRPQWAREQFLACMADDGAADQQITG